MANIIEQVNVGGTTYDIASTAYAVCSTAANEATKVVSGSYLTGLTATPGVTIHIKFANANSAANPTLTISNGDTTLNNAIPISGITTWTAGAVLTLTYDGTNWIRDYVEAIASNNITGSGTSGSLAKFNGNNTITNGPALASAISTQTQSTKFLREDGTWAAPSYTTNTDTKVKQSPITATTSAEYNILLKNSTGNGEETDIVKFANNSSKQVTINPSTGKITAPGGLAGNASSATEFSSGTTVKLTGNVTGESSSSKKGWTIATTIANSAVTNDMLAGSITNAKLVNDWIKIGNVTKHLGETFALSDLGIAAAMNFKGTTTTNLSDGDTTSPITVSGADYTPVNGDVVLNGGKEFVWTGTAWEELGDESSWALSNDVLHISGTKGDIIYWSDANSPAHLTAGSDGAVLKLSNGVPTWGTDNDTKVTQAYSTANKSYPLLFSNTDGITSTNSRGATTALVNNAIYVNPSTGTINATEFVGGGSGLTGVTAASVAWANVTGKVLAALYVNATSGGAANDTAATDNSNTYLHLYDNSAKQSTIRFIGAGGTSISSTANSKNITITSKKYKSTGSANALTSLTLTYNNGSAQTNSVSSTAVAIGSVENAILYIKSIEYGTTSVSTGVSEDNT